MQNATAMDHVDGPQAEGCFATYRGCVVTIGFGKMESPDWLIKRGNQKAKR